MQVYWLKISPKCPEQEMKIEFYTCYFNTVERKIMFYKLWDTETDAKGTITYKGQDINDPIALKATLETRSQTPVSPILGYSYPHV